MAGEGLKAGASAAAGTIVALVAAGAIVWNATAPQRAQLMALLEGLNAKVDKTTTVIADMSKPAAAPTGPASADAALAALSAKLDATNKSLAALAAKIDTSDKSLAALAVKIDASDKVLTEIKTASGNVGDLKSAATAHQHSLQQISTALDGLKAVSQTAPSPAPAPAPVVVKETAPAERELVVVYMPQSAAPPAAAPRGLSVRFDRTSAANANAQTQKLAGDLKSIVGNRKDCVISVAGYADTLGDDKVNLAVSRQRAEIVANGLRAALPGVEVKEVAWGERSLAVWTPDNKVEMANRRVDVNVECKG